MRLILIAAALLSLSPMAKAEVYQCEIDGQTIYTDHECLGRGGVAVLRALSVGNGGGRGVRALAQRYERGQARAAAAARVARRPDRRRVVGVSCPLDRAIRDAVDDHRLLLCMTPAEVDAAQPFDAERLLVHSRLLPVGPSVVEWVYDPDIDDWPAVVRFDNNHVIGYTNGMPEYYREHWAELRDRD